MDISSAVGASCARNLKKDVNTYKRKPKSKPKTKSSYHDFLIA